VGTAYKQQGREPAIKLGLDFFGPKMRSMTEYVESLTGHTPGTRPAQVLVHCWRGGMRSAGVAWLLDLYGFKVYTLAGGYKSYRQRIIQTFSLPFSFTMLGGYTGSGKTYVVEQLKDNGAAVINLEKLACHKGSAFGHIGMPEQPSQEMFENLLGEELNAFLDMNSGKESWISRGALVPVNSTPVWLEDESERIGHVNIPHPLWISMSRSPLIFISIPFEERLRHLVREYGNLDKQRMADAISRIGKRLGGLEAKMALQNLASGDVESCFRILLAYYDKLYNKALDKRARLEGPVTFVEYSTVDARGIADQVTANELQVK
jgi:tRNA 2-selenouridine synthase